ncbi:hypothetical protein F7226_08160 [Helicobacter pylori]|nr:hypothetical protein [Helicobacter pylori]
MGFLILVILILLSCLCRLKCQFLLKKILYFLWYQSDRIF